MRNKPKPPCWELKKCSHKRSYYKDHEKSKLQMLRWHRYRRFMSNSCSICQKKEELEAHHIKPQSIGGQDARENILTLCRSCHDIVSSYYFIIGLGYKERIDVGFNNKEIPPLSGTESGSGNRLLSICS